jgi:hypothetical protein
MKTNKSRRNKKYPDAVYIIMKQVGWFLLYLTMISQLHRLENI